MFHLRIVIDFRKTVHRREGHILRRHSRGPIIVWLGDGSFLKFVSERQVVVDPLGAVVEARVGA